MMDITDKDGMWKLTYGHITNLKTGEMKGIEDFPPGIALAHMPYKKYMTKCRIAFDTGKWPITIRRGGIEVY